MRAQKDKPQMEPALVYLAGCREKRLDVCFSWLTALTASLPYMEMDLEIAPGKVRFARKKEPGKIGNEIIQ